MLKINSRMRLLVLLLILCAGVAGSFFLLNRNTPRGNNVVFITIDTLRADHLGCYGYPRNTSPSIDALAARSILFTQCVSQAASTLPSHASMFTALYPPAHGVVNNLTGLAPSVPSLVEVFRKNGYATGAVVSSSVLESRFGLNQGFQTYDERFNTTELNRRNFPERRADATTGAAISWLEKHRKKPFFLWVHYNSPHGAYYPPPPYRELFVKDRWYRSDQPLPLSEENFVARTIPKYQALFGNTDPAYYISQYDGEVRFADDQIGRLFRFLEDSGMMPRTLVVVTADHGETFTERDLCFTHTFRTYDELAMIPLIMHLPGMQTPKRVTEQVRAIDIMPTVLDELGLKNLYPVNGRTLKDMISGADSASRPAVVLSDYGMDVFDSVLGAQKSLRTPHWKLTRNSKGQPDELYDLQADPEEKHNLAAQNPEVVGEMSKMLDEWQASVVKTEGLKPALSAEKVKQLESLGYVTK